MDNKNFKTLPLSKLVSADWNYKNNDDKLQKKLVANIKKTGQIENIIVRQLKGGKYEVVNGNHRYLAFKELDYNEVMVYDLGKISDAQAKRIAVETNETKFKSDPLKLAELMEELKLEFDDLEITSPFSEEELDNMSKTLQFDWNAQDGEGDTLGNLPDQTTNGPKSETLISAGADKFKTIKLEVHPDIYEKFETIFKKFTKVEPNHEMALSLMLNFLEEKSEDEIVELQTSLKPKKSKKTVSRKK